MAMALSLDLRKRVIESAKEGTRITEASKQFKVSRNAIYDWIKLEKDTGSLEPKFDYQKGHSHKITDWETFKVFAEKNKERTLKEMAVEWKKEFDVTISASTIRRALKKCNYTSKKKEFRYTESNEKTRQEYLEEIKDIDPSNLLYSDETGIDDNEVVRRGWAPRGERCHAKKKAKRTHRYNITAVLHNGSLVAPLIFQGYSNQAVYEAYIEQVLLPILRPGMVFIIDNASFHKSKRVIELVESVGCRVIFLPPYSPDLNPIEHFWSSIKHNIRKAAKSAKNFYDAAVQTLGDMCEA